MKKKEVPTFDELMDPTVQALKRLGGSASIDELVPEIVRLLNLPQEVADVPHGTTGRTELEYRSAWARTYLRKAGFIENSERGIWAVTPEGAQVASVDGRQIARDVAKQFQIERATDNESAGAPVAGEESEVALSWQDKLLGVLQAMDPIAFESVPTPPSRVGVHRSRGHETERRWRHRRSWHDPGRWTDQFQRALSG
jgi:restriction system protein